MFTPPSHNRSPFSSCCLHFSPFLLRIFRFRPWFPSVAVDPFLFSLACTASGTLRMERCEVRRCETPLQSVSYCVDCCSHFCAVCWDEAPAHQEGKLARDRLPHEKSNFHVAKRFENILHPQAVDSVLQEAHNDDENATWFGMRLPRRPHTPRRKNTRWLTSCVSASRCYQRPRYRRLQFQ